MIRLALLLLAVAQVDCAHVVGRDAQLYRVELEASVARQLEAAEQLLVAAELARSAGAIELCLRWAAPALLIEQAARHQANRSLYLAGLRYPGSLPPNRSGPAAAGTDT